MAETHGDVKINGKWYRIDPASYRDRDVVDFSPRAASPGGGIIHSELMLYQPLLQTDWRHGFGFMKYDDPSGYFRTAGNVDTRHEGIAMMFSDAVSSDTAKYHKVGGVTHDGTPYFWGPDGIRKFAAGAWSNVTAAPTTDTDLMFSLGANLFAAPDGARLRTATFASKIQVQPDEATSDDTYIDEYYPTSNFETQAYLRVGTIITTKHNSSYIKFSLANLPVGATITKAQLTLKVINRSVANPTIKVARALRAVVGGQATWNIFSTGNNWQTAGAKGALDRSATPMYSGTMTSLARQFFTMDLDLTEFAAMVADNKGMLVYEDYTGADLIFADFCSSGEANYDWRPYLYVEYTLASEWSDAGKDTNSKNYSWAVVHNGYTYLGEKNTNYVHYSSNATLTDLEGGATDVSKIVIGAGSYPTLGAISYMGYLYIARADGLWQLGDDKIAKRVLDFSMETSPLNFQSMVIHNGYLIFAIRDVIHQWNGARLTQITPPRLNDTWPYLTYGGYANFLAVGDFMYCTARTNEDVYTESLLCYDGVGWHKLTDLITDGLGKITMLFYDVSNNYLWVHKDSGDTQTTYYIPFQNKSNYPYPAFPVAGTHSLYSSLHDMGFARVTKSSPSLLVEAENLTAQTYLTVYYAVDGKEFVEWGTIKDNGITELILPGGVHTQEYKYIQLRVDFTTTVTAQSPILKSLTLRFLMRPDLAFGWNFNIVAADHFVYGEHEDARTSWKIISDIREARDSKAPIEFIDIDGGKYYAYVTSFSRSVQEINADEENEQVPSTESVVNVNLVEAK